MEHPSQSKIPWFGVHWVICALVFFCFPLAVVGYLFFGSYRLFHKLLAIPVVLLMGYGAYQAYGYFSETYQQSMWLRKFFQSRSRFEYQRAQEFLNRVRAESGQDKIEIALVRAEHALGLGNEKEAQNNLKLAKEEFAKEFFNLCSKIKLDFKKIDFEVMFARYLKGGFYLNLETEFKEVKLPELKEREFYRNAISLYRSLVGRAGGSNISPILLNTVFMGGKQKEMQRQLRMAFVLKGLLSELVGPFSLDFLCLAYAIEFSSPDNLKLLEKHHRKSVSTLLEEYVLQSSYNLKGYLLRARFRIKKGELNGAIKDLHHIHKLDVRFFESYSLLQTQMTSQKDLEFVGDYRRAEDLRFHTAEFERSIEISRDLLSRKSSKVLSSYQDEILFNLGVMYRNNLKDYQSAIEAFDEIMKLENTIRHEESLYNLVMCHLQLGDYPKAEESLNQLVRQFPGTDHRPRLKMIFVYIKIMETLNRLKPLGSAGKEAT